MRLFEERARLLQKHDAAEKAVKSTFAGSSAAS